MRKVLLPGSYDPITEGHLAVIRHALSHYDEVHVVVFVNPDKHTLFTLEERLALLRVACKDLPRTVTGFSTGMVADYASEHGIKTLLKGIRNEDDLAYEQPMADYHQKKGLDTLYHQAEKGYEDVSSSAVRHALESGGEIPSHMLTGALRDAVLSLFRAKKDACAEKSGRLS